MIVFLFTLAFILSTSIETSSVYFMATLSDQFGPKQMDMQLWIHFFVIYFLTNTAKGMTPRD